MTLSEVVPHLKAFELVVVTGPQRSGTTIATIILADSLGYASVLEEAFREDDLFRFGATLYNRRRCVVQAPAMAAICHLIKNPAIAVVFMMRPLADIVSSQNRIGWTATHDGYEKRKYLVPEDDPRPIASVKTQAWRLQKSILGSRAFELAYDSLAAHHLWVPRGLRTDFGPRQTTL